MTTLSARAFTILNEWVRSESLRKHCYAVADSTKVTRRSALRGYGSGAGMKKLVARFFRTPITPTFLVKRRSRKHSTPSMS